MSDKPAPVLWRDEHRVAVIVVNFRAPEFTIACVESVLCSKGVEPHVILIDNASDDDSADRLRRAFGDVAAVTCVARKTNDGYTGGNNAGNQ